MKDLIILKQLPVIEENLKSLSEEIDEKVKKASVLICTEKNKKDVKKVRSELNSQFKELEEQRKFVKNSVLEPYNKFEEIYKLCVSDKFKYADLELKNKIDLIENEQKQKLKNNALEYFEELLQANNIDFLKFDDMNLKIGVSDNDTKLRKQIDLFVEKTVKDLEFITKREHSVEILVEYKKSLDLMSAVNIVEERIKQEIEEKKRLEEVEKIEEQEQQVVKKVQQVVQAPKVEEICKLNISIWGTKCELKELIGELERRGLEYEQFRD